MGNGLGLVNQVRFIFLLTTKWRVSALQVGARTSLFSFLEAEFSLLLCLEPWSQSVLLSLELGECGSVRLPPVCPYLRWQAFQDPDKTQGYRKAFLGTSHFSWT